jgi:tetratricopeptide (TPR) repeat protein
LDEEAYAQRLQALATRYPKNADLAVLAAEALLNLHPYDWWSADGQALPWTPAIEALLQRALHLQPGHPGAHHYWIHLQESSARPQRAQASADRLRSAYPGSGHLLHMPSHIDMRSGRFDAAIRANQRSIEADRRYLEQVDAQGAYRIGYVAHNHHFLWAAAAMAGRGRLALDAARAAWPAACGPSGRDPGTAITMHYAALPYFTLVRFGLWDEILRGTAPPDAPGPYALALWHYARGTAYSRTGEPAQARRELAALDRLAAEPSLAAARLKNLNPSAQVLRIAQLSLRADIALATGRASEAVSLLREATAIEDAFSYDEPHLWLAPTRHALGDTLLAAHQPHDAEQVYRQDLAHYPENGWSLAGLARALQAQGRHDEARAVERRFKAAWRDADRALIRSRY